MAGRWNLCVAAPLAALAAGLCAVGCTEEKTVQYDSQGGGSSSAAPSVDPTELSGAAVGVSYDVQLRATGGAGGYVFAVVVTSGDATGLVFESSGRIHGVPAVAGGLTLEVTVTDAAGADATTIVPLQVAEPLTISTPSLPTAYRGLDYDAQLTASGGVPPYTWSLAAGATLPAGLVLTRTGQLLGVPTSLAPGAAFVVEVSDASDPPVTVAWTARVSVLRAGGVLAESFATTAARDASATSADWSGTDYVEGGAAPLDVGSGVGGALVLGAGTHRIDTDAGTVDGVAYAEPGDPGTFEFSTIEVQAGATVEVQGAQPLHLRAQGAVSIAGTLDLAGEPGSAPSAAVGGIGGAGGGAGGAQGGAGGGSSPGSGTLAGAHGEGPGGGEGGVDQPASSVMSGAGAGHALVGGDGAGTPGAAGGAAYFDPYRLQGGSGGGGGGANDGGTIGLLDGSDRGGAGGGGGGGALAITAGGDVAIEGVILASGAAGGTNTYSSGGTGGGGSGGAVRIRTAGRLVAGANARVDVTGGPGGNDYYYVSYDGGAGAPGAIRVEQAPALVPVRAVGAATAGGVDPSLDTGAGTVDLVVGADTTLDTDTGEIGGVTSPGFVGSGVFEFADVEVVAGVTLTVRGSVPLELKASGSVTIAGTIVASGTPGADQTSYGWVGTAAGAGGPGGGAGGAGGGASPGTGSVSGAYGQGPGGGRGGYGTPTPGGGGGHAEPGGSGSGGLGGIGYGDASLSVLQGGSGGGGGGAYNYTYYSSGLDSYDRGGSGGGGGGGAVRIAAAGTLAISGAIHVDGGAGGNGRGSYDGAAGGGGSGGAILLQSRTGIVPSGSELLSARGGAGGKPYWGATFSTGGSGASGRIRLEDPSGNLAPIGAGWAAPSYTLAPLSSYALARSTWLRGAVQGVPATDPEYGPATVTVANTPSGAVYRLEWQGCQPSSLDPAQPDASSATVWTDDPTELNGCEFVRFRIHFWSSSAGAHVRIDDVQVPFAF